MPQQLYVTMLGDFSVRMGDQVIHERSNRMRKVWLLLAYLIYARNTATPQSRYLSILQGTDTTEVEDPMGRLKALFYRARTMLDELEKGTGHRMILCKKGAYFWNKDIDVTVDAEEFDRLCRRAQDAADEEEKLTIYRKALSLYGGDFLDRMSMEQWVMPLHTYYHQLYLAAVAQTLDLLEKRFLWQESSELCRQALRVEPYSEELYCHLMRCQLMLGDKDGVMATYESMSELLFETFGVMPTEESRTIYREACRRRDETTVPIDTVREYLREEEGAHGAVLCEYDFFRFHYRVMARSIVRTGDVIHIALLSVHGAGHSALQRRSLDRAMDNLQAILLDGLRRGDVISRCSVSQMIIMLPGANYDDSCNVCRRLIKAFQKKYPHSPAELHYSVQPMEPLMPEPMQLKETNE